MNRLVKEVFNWTNLVLFLAILSIVLLGLAYYSHASLGGDGIGSYRCDTNTGKTCNFSFPLSDSTNFQAYAYDVSTNIDGLKGSNAYLYVSVCLTTGFWGTSSAICNDYGPGDYNGGPLTHNKSDNIDLGDLTGYRYVSFHVTVDDMNTNTTGLVKGRRVEIKNFWPTESTITSGNCTKLNWDIDQVNDGNYVVTKDGSGSTISSGNLSEPLDVCPTSTTTYTLEIYGPAGAPHGNSPGWISDTTTITVVDITGPFKLGGSCSVENSSENKANLNWTVSKNADKYQIWHREWTGGTVRYLGETTATTFSNVVRNDVDYYYQVKAVNTAGGRIADPDWLFVCGAVGSSPTPTPTPGAPSCTLNFSPPTVSNPGDPTTATWSSSGDANGILPYSCTGNIGSGNLNASDSMTVNPTSSQSCTLTVSNSVGSDTCSAPISVGSTPTPTPQGAINIDLNPTSGSPKSSYTASVFGQCGGGNEVNVGVSPSAGSCSGGSLQSGCPNWRWNYSCVAPNSPNSSVNVRGSSNGGSATAVFNVTGGGGPEPSSADITCSPSTVPYNSPAQIYWSSSNVSNCTVSPTGWTGTSGSQSTGNLTSSTTYTVTCNP